MTRLSSLPLVVLSLLITSCTQTPTMPPAITGPYIEPENLAEGVATLSGIIDARSFPLDDIRAMVVSIDSLKVRITSPQPSPIKLLAGAHRIGTMCEHKWGTGRTYAAVDLTAQGAHIYVLHCAELNPIYNAGEKFWIVDQTMGGNTVSTGEGWGPSHGPSGKAF
jgi:hypothetical protein